MKSEFGYIWMKCMTKNGFVWTQPVGNAQYISKRFVSLWCRLKYRFQMITLAPLPSLFSRFTGYRRIWYSLLNMFDSFYFKTYAKLWMGCNRADDRWLRLRCCGKINAWNKTCGNTINKENRFMQMISRAYTNDFKFFVMHQPPPPTIPFNSIT